MGQFGRLAPHSLIARAILPLSASVGLQARSGSVHVGQGCRPRPAPTLHHAAPGTRRSAPDVIRLDRVGRIHELGVEVESRGVTGMSDPTDHLSSPNRLARGDRHGARSQVREEREGVGTLHDHMVAGHQVDSARAGSNLTMALRTARARAPPGAGPARAPGPPPPRPAVEGCMDGLAPAVVVAGAPAEQGGTQGAGRVEVQALALVGPDEVEGVALAELVGAVAGIRCAGVRTATHSPRGGIPRVRGWMACASPPSEEASATETPERSHEL
jgi:hypothetical protein